MNTARILYALLTWILLWTFAGGTVDLFWTRLPIAVVLLVGLSVAVLFVYPWEYTLRGGVSFRGSQLRRLWLLDSTKAPPLDAVETLPANCSNFAESLQLKWVLWPLLSLFIATGIAAYGMRSESAAPWLKFGVASYASHDVLRVLGLSLFISAYVFLTKAVLQREWGLGNVVFLMSITLGFASQQLSVFLVAVLIGGLYALIAEKINFITAWVGESIWFLVFFVALALAT